MTEPLSLAIRPLMSVVGKVLQPARRLYLERSAGLIPVTGPTGPPELDRFFDATLARLSGGNIEDGWWRNLLDRAGYTYVAPDVLQREDLQTWLRDDQVQADLKALTGARILEASEAPEIRSRLQRKYAAITHEAQYLTDEPIEVVVAILLAAFVAGLGPGGEQLASLTLGSQRQIRADLNRGFEEVTRRLEDLGPDRLTEEVHTQRASEELTRIRQRRAWAPALARERVRQLVERIQSGHLRYTASSVQGQALYWAARLHASEPEHLEEAKRFRDQLRQLDPVVDTRIVDALILETEGNGDGALRVLRDAGDPETRSVLFLILCKVRGPAAALEWFYCQKERLHSHFLTGTGWSNVALALVQVDRWEEAAAILATASECQEEWPDMLYLEGVINAALLVPSEWRRHALEMNLFHPWVHTVEGPEANRRREHATHCFQQAEKRMVTDFPERAAGTREWLRWLRLTDPDPAVSETAREEVREGMQDPANALSLLPMAKAFGIPFEAGLLKGYLDQRMRLGGLEDHELQARFLLSEMSLEPAALITLLDEEEAVFRRVTPAGLLSFTRIEALAKTDQTAKARSLLEERQEEFSEDERQRIEAMLEEHEGRDPRPRLEQLYDNSHDLIDLQNLVGHLHRVRDWTALRRRLEELFQRERTLENALHLVSCMRHDPGSHEAEVLAFLEANEDLVDRNPDLRSARAWALFRTGRLDEARALNDRLLSERDHPLDLQLDINFALQSGAWERFFSIVEREWPKREEREPDTLIRLASLAAEVDATVSRAVELVKLAVTKGGGNPQVLATAIGLMYRLGREGEETRDWLTRAVALSSEEGPVRAVDLRTMVEEWMPADRERRRTVEEHWLHGEIPLHIAASELNVPLSYLLIGLPRSNAPMQDGRRRTVIPIVSGARQPVLIRPEWAVGLDITSLMVLAHLGLLEKAIQSFQRVILAPDTMFLLLNERNKVRFHQPSRVKKAEEILGMIGAGQLRTVEALPSPPQWLIDQVGADLAQLLQTARESQGRVVRPRPIHKAGSLMNEAARLGDYDGLVVSTVDFERLLHEKGVLDIPTHERASRFLQSQDQSTRTDAEVSLLNGSLYLDDLALTYLQNAGILPTLASSGLDLRIHPSTRQEQTSLIESHRQGEQLAEAIEEIRVTLLEALQAGNVGFLPRHDPPVDQEQIAEAAPTLSQFLQDVGPCEAVCIDDRFVTKNSMLTDRQGKTVAVPCVLDVLRHLEARGVLTSGMRQNTLHRLRQSGFAFVSVEPDELKRLLTSVHWQEDGTFIESAELRIIRQTLARMRSLDILRQPEEMAFLGSLRYTSLWVISQLWIDEAIPEERAAYLTDWIWRHTAPSPLDWHEVRGEEAFVPYLGLLLQPFPIISKERRQAFQSWIQERALAPLLPANSNVLVRLAVLAGQHIEEWSERIAAEDRENSDS